MFEQNIYEVSGDKYLNICISMKWQEIKVCGNIKASSDVTSQIYIVVSERVEILK